MFHTPLSREEQLEIWREKKNKKKIESLEKKQTRASTNLVRPPKHLPSMTPRTSNSIAGSLSGKTPSPSVLLQQFPSNHSKSQMSSERPARNRRGRSPIVSFKSTTGTSAGISTRRPRDRRYSSLLSRAPLSQLSSNDRSLISQPAVRCCVQQDESSLSSQHATPVLSSATLTGPSPSPVVADTGDFSIEWVEFRRHAETRESLVSALSCSFGSQEDNVADFCIKNERTASPTDISQRTKESLIAQECGVGDKAVEFPDGRLMCDETTSENRYALLPPPSGQICEYDNEANKGKMTQEGGEELNDMPILESALAAFERTDLSDFDWRKDGDDDDLLNSKLQRSVGRGRRSSRKRREQLLLPIPSLREEFTGVAERNDEKGESPMDPLVVLETPTCLEGDGKLFDWRNRSDSTPRESKTARRRTDNTVLLLPIPSLRDHDLTPPSAVNDKTVKDTGVPKIEGKSERLSARRNCRSHTPCTIRKSSATSSDGALVGTPELSPTLPDLTTPKRLGDESPIVSMESSTRQNVPLIETCYAAPVEVYRPAVKVNEKSLLPTIVEGAAERSDDVISQLRDQVDALMVEKQNLTDRLAAIRKAYEDRVTPFRDVFEEKRTLLLENRRYATEKKAVEDVVSELRTKMMSAVNKAVQKTVELQAQLDETNRRNAELQRELGARK